MHERIKKFISEVEEYDATAKEQVESFRLKYLSKKGVLAELFTEMKTIQPELRKEFGKLVNELKTKAEEKLHSFEQILEAGADEDPSQNIDLTLPADSYSIGARHPISITRRRI